MNENMSRYTNGTKKGNGFLAKNFYCNLVFEYYADYYHQPS